jgi:peptidoglycan/LPS O-acetylase OafA/YrhL
MNGTSKNTPQAPFLKSFNDFRGIAIATIVAGHCFDLAGWHGNTFAENFLFNLVAAGGSCLFVFISGFLFHHVFYPRFIYRKFMLAKVRNVLLPYLVMSAAPIAYYVLTQKPHLDGIFLPQGHSILHAYIIPVLKYLATGAVFFPYWYIPFIMLMFVLSPIHVLFIERSARVRVAIVAVLLTVALLLHRSVDNLNPIQSLVYFMPVYLLGMICSIHKDLLYTALRGKEIIAGALLLGLITAQTTFHVGAYNKAPFVYGGVDWVLVQKVLLCPWLMVVLHRFEERRWPLLPFLAAASFGIYFIHAWVLVITYVLKAKLSFEISMPFFVSWPAAVALTIAVSAGIARVAKELLDQRSRMVIGW